MKIYFNSNKVLTLVWWCYSFDDPSFSSIRLVSTMTMWKHLQLPDLACGPRLWNEQLTDALRGCNSSETYKKKAENSGIPETLLMIILLYFIMLLYFISYYLYSNVYCFTLYVSYIMLSHHCLRYISQILVFKPKYIIIVMIIPEKPRYDLWIVSTEIKKQMYNVCIVYWSIYRVH